MNCQANCEFEDYLSDSEYLKCKCDVVNEEKIETKQPEKNNGQIDFEFFL